MITGSGEAMEASKRRRCKLVYRIQKHSKGSSEGSGIILEVPDEPKDNSGSSSSSLSRSDDESMVDVPIHQEDPAVQRTPLVDTVISVLEKKVEAMPKRAWTKKDQKWTDEMVKMIDNLLLERRFKKSLECFVGGRTVEIDYRLLTVLLNFKVLSCILSYEYVNM
ncbi:hypothetical protein Tco_1225619 [Tanacetum coccineum]